MTCSLLADADPTPLAFNALTVAGQFNYGGAPLLPQSSFSLSIPTTTPVLLQSAQAIEIYSNNQLLGANSGGDLPVNLNAGEYIITLTGSQSPSLLATPINSINQILPPNEFPIHYYWLQGNPAITITSPNALAILYDTTGNAVAIEETKNGTATFSYAGSTGVYFIGLTHYNNAYKISGQ